MNGLRPARTVQALPLASPGTHPEGRGGALQHVWAPPQAKVVAYLDADLSTDLSAGTW